MKRHLPDRQYFSLLKMLDDFIKSNEKPLQDGTVLNEFISRISEAIEHHRNNPIRLYGFRTESLFAYVAAALGKCKVISEEDSGALFSIDENIRRPDFRIVTMEHEQFFVEVKNYHQKEPIEPLSIKYDYLLTLKNYTDIFQRPLKIAIFWSRWNLWTLVDVNNFIKKEAKILISMPEAMKKNEMNLLGDHMIGTVPALSLRLYADKTKPRSRNNNNKVNFTIDNVSLLAGDTIITDEFEKKLVWFLIMHSKWDQIEQFAEIKNKLLEFVEFSISPQEYDKNQGFAIHGFLSELIVNNYKSLTSPKGIITRLTPSQQPDKLSILIPNDYKSKELKLWRFHVQPNYEDLIQ